MFGILLDGEAGLGFGEIDILVLPGISEGLAEYFLCTKKVKMSPTDDRTKKQKPNIVPKP